MRCDSLLALDKTGNSCGMGENCTHLCLFSVSWSLVESSPDSSELSEHVQFSCYNLFAYIFAVKNYFKDSTATAVSAIYCCF